jgi:hypothetical protein
VSTWWRSSTKKWKRSSGVGEEEEGRIYSRQAWEWLPVDGLASNVSLISFVINNTAVLLSVSCHRVASPWQLIIIILLEQHIAGGCREILATIPDGKQKQLGLYIYTTATKYYTTQNILRQRKDGDCNQYIKFRQWILSFRLPWEKAEIPIYVGNGGTAPRILNLGTSWMWVISLAPQQPYPQQRVSVTHLTGDGVGS